MGSGLVFRWMISQILKGVHTRGWGSPALGGGLKAHTWNLLLAAFPCSLCRPHVGLEPVGGSSCRRGEGPRLSVSQGQARSGSQ